MHFTLNVQAEYAARHSFKIHNVLNNVPALFAYTLVTSFSIDSPDLSSIFFVFSETKPLVEIKDVEQFVRNKLSKVYVKRVYIISFICV